MTCKEERLAVTREANSKAEASVTAEQQKKLQERVDKCKQDSQKVRTANLCFLKPPEIIKVQNHFLPYKPRKASVMFLDTFSSCCPKKSLRFTGVPEQIRVVLYG